MPDYAYMAYLDILGYKEFLHSDITQGTEIFKNKMISAFRVFDGVNQTKFAHKAISDSIFITCSDRDAVFDLLHLLRKVFHAFLSEGLLIRGGLSFGQHFQNQNITYSPVLTKAYLLESNIAIFPRIMIDDNIIAMFPGLHSQSFALRSGNQWYLNIATADSVLSLWEAAGAAYLGCLSQIKTNEQARIKHRWLQDYLTEIAEVYSVKLSVCYIKTFD